MRHSSGLTETRRPAVSFVVIGLDEAAHLERSLVSLLNQGIPRDEMEVIYVDSGSVDGSMGIARRLGVDQVASIPRSEATAGKARNRGAQLARGHFIQFVDGDTTLEPGWVRSGIASLTASPNLAGVAGSLSESRPTRNIFHRVLDMDWPSSAGSVPFVGGNALYTRRAFQEAGGFNERLRLGEEPELGFRLRQLGWKLHQTARPMGSHDIDVTTCAEYMRQLYRNGVACGLVVKATGGLRRGFWRERLIGLFAWSAILCLGPILALFTALASPPLGATLAGTGLVLFAALLGRKARFVSRQGSSIGSAVAYAVHTYASKIPQAFGAMRGLIQ